MNREEIKKRLAEFDRRPRSSLTEADWNEVDRLEGMLAKVAPKRKGTMWRAGEPIPNHAWPTNKKTGR